MPYKKTYRKKTYRKPKCSNMDIAMKAWKGVKSLRGIINSELKYVEQSDAFTNVTNTGATTCISRIAQGDLDSQRNGNSVLAKTLYLKYLVLWNTASPGNIIKVYLVKDNQQIADTSPVFTDIFNTNSIDTFPFYQTKKRFQIIDMKTLTYDTSRLLTIVEFSQKLDHHLLFNGTTVNDIQKGHYYVCWHSNTATNHPQIALSKRITFYDN